MDPLADVFELASVSGVVLANVSAYDPWGVTTPAMTSATFHAVTAGTCWMRVEGSAPRQLVPGDLVMFPTGARHELVSDPSQPAIQYQRLVDQHGLSDDGDLVLPGDGDCTRFVCARYDFDAEVVQPLLTLLPPALVVSAGDPTSDSAIQSTLRLLAMELGRPAPGRRAIVERLIDVLFLHTIRVWMETSDGAASWLAALRDPVAARALAIIHARPGEPWTVASLAREVGVSRATLARQFSDRVGESPVSYLTRWRMDIAARRLRQSEASIAEIARAIGYGSDQAFSRAFTRQRQIPPGEYRASHQASEPAVRSVGTSVAPRAGGGR